MAKRKRSRPNLPKETLARARAELYGEEEAAKIAEKEAEESATEEKARPAPKKRPAKKGGTARRREVLPVATSVEQLREEYVYVIADLRSMGLLAGALFVALVVASLILV